MTTTNQTRKVGRPKSNSSRADSSARPRKRVPIHGSRDILNIAQGKDPAYVYRYVKDAAESGARILRFIDAGYEFVRSDMEDLGIGENHVYKSKNNGSIIAVKEGAGYLYLMKIRREYYEEDQAAKEDDIAAKERMMKRRRKEETDDGYYGKPSISGNFIP